MEPLSSDHVTVVIKMSVSDISQTTRHLDLAGYYRLLSHVAGTGIVVRPVSNYESLDTVFGVKSEPVVESVVRNPVRLSEVRVGYTQSESARWRGVDSRRWVANSTDALMAVRSYQS